MEKATLVVKQGRKDAYPAKDSASAHYSETLKGVTAAS